MTERTVPPAPPTDDIERHDPGEDAGRLDGASTGRLVLILAALVLLSEILPLQQLMVAVALPKIAVSFPGAGAGVTWAVAILGVVGGSTMALIGKLGDTWGKKRVLSVAVALFLVGTLICALTDNWALFLLGRGIGAISWGMAAPASALMRDLFPRRWIPVCVAVIGTGFGVSAIAGPLIVGALTDHHSWRWVFWFLFAYTAATLPLFYLVTPESPLRVRTRIDYLGALLLGAGVGLSLVYVSEGSSWGWGSAGNLGYLIGGLAALAAFLAWEMRTAHPMMELRLLRAPKVSYLMLISLLVTGVLTGIGLAIAYMFETPTPAVLNGQILAGAAAKAHIPLAAIAPLVHFHGDISYAAGFSILQLGVHITIWTAAFGMLFGPVGGYLSQRGGARRPLIAGLAALLLACVLWVPWHSSWPEQLLIGLIYSVGFGFFYATNPNLVMDAVPPQRQGVAGGMIGVAGGIGVALATALFTAIIAAHPYQLVVSEPTGASVTTNIPGVYDNAGYSMVYVLLGVVPAAIALLLAVALRSGRTPARGGAPEGTGLPQG